MKKEIRISGQGGQGIILASIILAEASGIYDGKFVVQSQVYGAAARGEISKADVIISDSEIYFPEVLYPDVLVALSEESYKNYSLNVKPEGMIFIDDFYVRNFENKENVFPFPFLDISMKIMGKKISMNIASLGGLSGLTDCVRFDSLESVIRKRFKGDILEKNLLVLKEAYEFGKRKMLELKMGGKNG